MSEEKWSPKAGERAVVYVTVEKPSSLPSFVLTKEFWGIAKSDLHPDPVPLLRELMDRLGENCDCIPGMEHQSTCVIEKVRAAYPEAFEEATGVQGRSP